LSDYTPEDLSAITITMVTVIILTSYTKETLGAIVTLQLGTFKPFTISIRNKLKNSLCSSVN